MAFRNAVNADYHTLQRGENGTLEYTDYGVGSDVLALSQMVRKGDPRPLVDSILQTGTSQEVADLMVLIFATRNSRGGKGEKKLAYDMFLRVYCKALPETALALLKLFPHYGYWKDLLLLIKYIQQKPNVKALKKTVFFKAAIKILSEQLVKDMRELEQAKTSGSTPSISLLAKWLPRENAALDNGVVNALSQELFSVSSGGRAVPDSWKSRAKRLYRKTVSELTSYLALPEVLLAAQREEEIEFDRVASRATMLYRRVFYNQDTSGNPRSNNPKRVALAKRFMEHTIEKGLKGSQLMPHEIVQKIMNSYGRIGEAEEAVLDAQWKSLRESVLQQINEAAENDDFEPSRMVPLSDVSGSMSGTPMEVSIALGILLSEITHPAFRGMVMTFETQPRWHRLYPAMTIVDKVRSLQQAPWGGSTNFAAAYRLILEVARKHRLARDEVPNLIVFSDMQFDVAQYGLKPCVMHEQIRKDFQKTAEILGWKDRDPMTMVYWNLRNTRGHPVNRDTEGAVMLSGFSPSLLKLVMNGKALEETEVQVVNANGTVTTEKVKVTPQEILRKMLDDELYDPVRAVLDSSTEGKLEGFVIPVEQKLQKLAISTENQVPKVTSSVGKDPRQDDFVMV